MMISYTVDDQEDSSAANQTIDLVAYRCINILLMFLAALVHLMARAGMVYEVFEVMK
jgi:hypothetical protein